MCKENGAVVSLDGLIAYSMPQGDKRGYNAQFWDETYDGENDNGTLKGSFVFY